MAFPFAPFAMTQQPEQAQEPGFVDQATANLRTILGNPLAQTAMLNAGIALMQPPQWGEGFTAQLGRGIAAGGEAVRSAEAQRLKEEELGSKQALRESQAIAAEARASRAGAGTETQQARLALQESEIARRRDADVWRNYNAAQSIYAKEKEATERANIIKKPSEKVQMPPFEQWLQQKYPGLSLDLSRLGTGGALGAPRAPGAPAPQRQLSKDVADARAAISSGKISRSEAENRLRKAGVQYRPEDLD